MSTLYNATFHFLNVANLLTPLSIVAIYANLRFLLATLTYICTCIGETFGFFDLLIDLWCFTVEMFKETLCTNQEPVTAASQVK